ncbi:MAG: histidine kinase dimerization/phosphoacceptor domain -containing protein [Bacteroidota bacterium]
MILRFTALLSFCVITFCSLAQQISFTAKEKQWIADNPVVYFGYDPNWPPYEIYAKGKYSGMCADFVEKISERTGIRFVPLKNMTWEKTFHRLTQDKLTMAPAVGITPDRLKTLVFSEYYIKLPVVIATTRENRHLKSLKDLYGKKISIPKNYLQEEILKRDYPEIRLVLRDNFAECLKDVSSGESVATVGSLGSISYFIKENAFSNLIISGHTKLKTSGVAFAFPKSKKILRDIVDKALKTISHDERSKIYSKWVTVNIQKEYNYNQVWKYIVLVMLILAIVLVMFYLWNKSLRKQIFLRKRIEEELSHTLEQVNKQNNDKTVLLQEIHHRVKNNLQIIISLLRLQANSHTNSDVQDAIYEAVERVNSISLVHEHLYKNPNLGEIDLSLYITNLGEELKRVFIKDFDVSMQVETHDTQLSIKAIIPLALILNELITNSLKYAFRNTRKGTISIHLFIENKRLHFHYSDNGEWFHNDYSRNFGTYLLDIFTEQLNGEYKKLPGDSASYIFTFKDF